MNKTMTGYRMLPIQDYDTTQGRFTRFGKRTTLIDRNLISELREPDSEKITRSALRKRKKIEKYGC